MAILKRLPFSPIDINLGDETGNSAARMSPFDRAS